MKEITVKDIKENLVKLIEEDYFLLTAERADGKVNCMTAQWGTIGHLWGANTAIVFVRPERYTHEFMEEADNFSLCFFDNKPELMRYMGTVSGRDEDKVEKQGLTVKHSEKTPYFAESKLVICCKKLYKHTMTPEGFTEPGLKDRFYSKEGYHDCYVGRIESVLISE